MTVFEYSFTLIGLVLGLALTEVLGGLLRTARSRGVRSLGLLTPLLATFVVVDAAATWGFVYGTRSTFGESVWPVLGFGVVLSSLYYRVHDRNNGGSEPRSQLGHGLNDPAERPQCQGR